MQFIGYSVNDSDRGTLNKEGRSPAVEIDHKAGLGISTTLN